MNQLDKKPISLEREEDKRIIKTAINFKIDSMVDILTSQKDVIIKYDQKTGIVKFQAQKIERI